MAFLFFSMMTLLSAVHCGRQHPFHQVHGSRVSSSGETFASDRDSAFSPNFSGNIIEQTRAQAEITKKTLRSIAENKEAAQYIDNVIEKNICINNLEDAIEAIEEAAKLVENNGDEILDLAKTVESLENEKDIPQLVRSSANVLRKLSKLVHNLAEQPYKVCNANSETTIDSLSSLAKLVEDISHDDDIPLEYGDKLQLKSASKLLSEMSAFLGQLNKSLTAFNGLCVEGKDYNTELLKTIGDIMTNMAALFDSRGSVGKATGLKNSGSFVKQIEAAFHGLDIEFELDCGSISGLAQTMDELAEVVESIGVKKLSKELGVNLNFINQL